MMTHGYMMSGPAPYMDPHAQGYMMTPPRPADPYDNVANAAHFYSNGSQFQGHPDPYYCSPARSFNMQQQQHPVQAPNYSMQMAGGPVAVMGPSQGFISGQNSVPTNYQATTDHRAPFRLHSDQPETPSKTPPVKNLVQQPKHSEVVEGRVQAKTVSEVTRPVKSESPVAKPALPVKPVSSGRSTTPKSEDRPRSNGHGSSTPSAVLHTAIPTPSIDDMEPQNVSFIETPSGKDEADHVLPRRLRNLNITSGNRTYRIPHELQSSPPRPALVKTFQLSQSPVNAPKSPSPSPPAELPQDEAEEDASDVKTAKLKDNVEADRGFIITFDDVTAPKRPKPQLGMKRSQQQQMSPKKSASLAPAEISSPVVNNKEAIRVSSLIDMLSLLKFIFRLDLMFHFGHSKGTKSSPLVVVIGARQS